MEFQASILASIHDIAAEQWDRCLGPDDLLVSHRHLAALEDSGVASPENGFTPSHVVLRDSGGRIVAAAPAYLKTHNDGEMAIDMGLRLAQERLAGPYYPKLQVEVPMVPFAGARLLVCEDLDRTTAVRALVEALQQAAEERGASSVQIAYMKADDQDTETLRDLGLAISESNTYVWRAGEDSNFADFVARLTSRRRNALLRERRQVKERGLSFRYLRGKDVAPEMVPRVFEFYLSTFDRHANKPWLNEAYFRRVFETMADSVDLSVSTDGDTWAGAVYCLNGPTRGHVLNWGQGMDIRYLHFEQVIFRGIERGFVTGLDTLDFGGVGAHKAERGLKPTPVNHAFWFRDAGMRQVAEQACQHKRVAAEKERAAELARLPFAAGREG